MSLGPSTSSSPEPGSVQKPGTMPLEASRDTGDGILVSIYPDYCWTPVGDTMVIVPYTIHASQDDEANTTATVRQTELRSHNAASIIIKCMGDEPGTGGGITSGTTGSICEPKTWSPTVRFEGHGAVRHSDEWWMNKRNTTGKLTYNHDIDGYGAVVEALPSSPPATSPGNAPTDGIPPTPTGQPGVYSDAIPSAPVAGQQYADAGAAAMPMPAGGASTSATPSPSSRVGSAAWRAMPWSVNPMTMLRSIHTTLDIAFNEEWPIYMKLVKSAPALQTATGVPVTADGIKAGLMGQLGVKNNDELQALIQKAQAAQAAQAASASGADTGTRTSARTRTQQIKCPCTVLPYILAKNTCPVVCPGTQAHHIVPDKYLGTGNRDARMAGDRIPTPAGSACFPSFNDGPSICLVGNAASTGTEHNTAHQGDALINQTGANSPIPGTLPIGDVLNISVSAAVDARPDCRTEIETSVTNAFDGVDQNALCRASNMPPSPGSPAYNSLKPSNE